MSKYINRKRYKKKCISGEVNFPYNTEFLCLDDGMITHNDKPICYNTSQDAYDYFVRNDDNCGMERGKIIEEIFTITKNRKSSKYNDIWDMLWNDETIKSKFKNSNHEEVWLWSFDFYNAEINELRTLLYKIKNV